MAGSLFHEKQFLYGHNSCLRTDKKGTRILIVEDEAIIALDIKDILSRLGFTNSEIVCSGEESVTKAALFQPDLVLMDIKLKGKMNGVQAAQCISECLRIPVVYISAYSDDINLNRTKETSPFGYINKPFDESEVQDVIKHILPKNYN